MAGVTQRHPPRLSVELFRAFYATRPDEERWQLIDDGKMLEVAFTVDDPGAFVDPWSGLQRYRRVQATLSEQVCAENNTALFDYHIPVADQPDF